MDFEHRKHCQDLARISPNHKNNDVLAHMGNFEHYFQRVVLFLTAHQHFILPLHLHPPTDHHYKHFILTFIDKLNLETTVD